MKKHTVRIIVDAVMTAALIALCFFERLSETGHELLGLVFGGAVLIHLIVNRRSLFWSSKNGGRNWTFALNILTGIAIGACVISGLLISELFPALNTGLRLMYRLHYYSFILTAILVTAHIAAHFSWVRSVFAKFRGQNRTVITASAALALVVTIGAVTVGCSIGARELTSDNGTQGLTLNAETDAAAETSTEAGTESQAIPDTADEETVETEAPVVKTEEPLTEAETTESETAGEESDQTVFNAESLAQYNGKNGMPAYIAVGGVVYDVSSLFRNGSHHGYSAGVDLTEAFYREHTDRELRGLTVVGTYED